MFSFMPEQAALQRVLVIMINGMSPVEDPTNDPLSKLENFSIMACRCYDPNEEAVLKRIIKTVGVKYFDRRLRSLAKGCRRRGAESLASSDSSRSKHRWGRRQSAKGYEIEMCLHRT